MRVHFQKLGAGPAMVLMHGLFGCGSNLASVARDMSASHSVYLTDLRNHGRSPHAATMSYAEMVNDILELLDTERLSAPILLGHSMGGKVAMSLALTAPERVGALIVVDIAPVSYSARLQNLVATLLEFPIAQLTSRAHADAVLAGSIGDARLRGFLLQNLVFRNGRYDWRINLPAIGENLREIFDFPSWDPVAAYDGPTLFVRGQLSRFVRPEHESLILQMFPNATIKTIAAAGHWVHAEQLAQFLASVHAFLGSAHAAVR